MNEEKKTIFLVDDDVTNLTVGRNALAEHYNVSTLNSGARLLKLLEKSAPDLILLDIEMPEMNGYETIKILKSNEKTANIPVIFLTGKNNDESELEGLSLGAVDYITKPFSQELLLKRIEVHLLVETQKKKLIHFNNNLQEMVEERTKTVVELQDTILNTMAKLVEFRDDITGGHVERTQKYLDLLLSALREKNIYMQEISGWNTKLVLQSSQLHDIGKVTISDSILQKPGKLTDEEFTKMKEHTSFGEKVFEEIKKNTTQHEFLEYAEIFAAAHHEKWDGSGYPKGLKGEEIPLGGRLMAIVDVYDALVSERPYKKAFTHEEAAAIILEGRGNHFDPALVDVFDGISGEFGKVAEECKLRNSV